MVNFGTVFYVKDGRLGVAEGVLPEADRPEVAKEEEE